MASEISRSEISRNFREILDFVFREIWLKFREISQNRNFVKNVKFREIEIPRNLILYLYCELTIATTKNVSYFWQYLKEKISLYAAINDDILVVYLFDVRH